jgi:hypothetical protein
MSAAPGLAQPSVHLDTGGREWVTADTPIEVVAFPPPGPQEGRLAFVLGSTDATDLFRPTARGFVYRPELMPLPPGETDLVVYLVAPAGGWSELARLRLKVLRKGGFDRAVATPRLDVAAEVLVSEGGTGPAVSPAPDTEKLNAQLDFQGVFARGGWTLEPKVNVVGVTVENEAIRFGQLGEEAPQVDLSAYSVGVVRGVGSFQLGSVAFGQHRHLLTGFSSRGLQLRVPLGRTLDVTLAAMNGSQIVGWDNPTGLQEQDHRILAGTVGVELAPERPGGLRIEGVYLDGRQKPVAGFNQGVVNDAEKSRGLGFRVLASSASQRFRLDGGWSTSRFENPPDPLLAQGAELVPVEPESRDAHYVDLHAGVLQTQTKTGRPISLSLAVRHSRIEPQYRTVGTLLQADRQEDTAEASAFLGPVGGQLSYTLAEDNLDDVRSILTTKTRRAAGSVSAPLSQLFAGPGAPPLWLPTLSYTLDRTHQFGTGVPPDGEFSISFVPDQVSFNQTAALDWFFSRARGGLRYGRSFQDNRQEGREAADLLVSTYGVTVGVSPRAGLDVGLDAVSEQAENRELRQDLTTFRYGLNLTWNVSAAISLAALLAWTETEQDPRAQEGEAWNADAQVAWRFERRHGERHGIGGRIFLRYVIQSAETRNFPLAADPAIRAWKLNAGLGLSLF